MPLASFNKTGRKLIETMFNFYYYTIVIRVGGVCRYLFKKGCKSVQTELSIHFESFNSGCAIVKEARGKSVDSGFKTNAC